MKQLIGIVLLLGVGPALAHQPVMDMAPRWADGYGFQIRQEHYGAHKLKQGSQRTGNPLGLKRSVDTTWLEGVYTFKPQLRATIKIPYVRQRRTRELGGRAVRQRRSGLGDVIVGLPLKHYKNRGAKTENWGITPSLRLPTGSHSGAFPISDGSWDVGIGASYSAETPLIYQFYNAYYWHQGSGSRGMQSGDVLGVDINVGLHPLHSNEDNSGLFTLWDVSVHHQNEPNSRNLTTASGGDRVQTGPVLVYYRQSFMARAEFKFLAYERVDGTITSRGNEFSLAVGFAF